MKGRRASRVLLGLVGLWFAIPVVAPEAQVIDRLRKRVERAAENEVGRKLESATRDAVRCALGDTACAEKAEKDGKSVVFVDQKGAVVTDEHGRPISNAAAAQRATEAPGTGVWRNYDFVPGSTVWFALDLSREPVGRFPGKQLEFVTGNAQVVERDGERMLEVAANSVFRVPLRDSLPSDFTVEFDFQASAPHRTLVMLAGGNPARSLNGYSHHYLSVAQATGIHQQTRPVSETKGFWRVHQEPTSFKLQVDGDPAQPHDYAILYAGSERAAQMPNASFPRSRFLEFQITATRAEPAYLRSIVVAVHADPLYDALTKDGAFTTRGILFDHDSDRLRPESTPTLEVLVSALKEHPDLRVAIEGHTDSLGSDDYNRDLSERRSRAVAAYLATQGVDAGRITPVGRGEAEPVADNATEAGRQQNRRVVIRRIGAER